MGQLGWSIGSARVTRFVDIEAPLDAQAFFPDSSPEALDRHRSWLEPDFMDRNGQLLLSIHALLVEIGGVRILVDTCLGEHRVPGFEDMPGRGHAFLEEMAQAGAPRESIDVVLCTHLHFDHVGWNTMREGSRWVPTFPNARYLFARAEWEHWSAAGDATTYAPTLRDAVKPVLDAGQADLVAGDHRVCDGVRLVPTPGHTPGHVSVRIASGGAEALVTGDATHHPVQLAEPDWGMDADVDRKLAAATRRRMIAVLADSDTLVIGTHYAGATAGHVVRGEAGTWFRARR
jgi:glyoxylase-like metal-dependent hydrolase (beta-lactamase superfamily II)